MHSQELHVLVSLARPSLTAIIKWAGQEGKMTGLDKMIQFLCNAAIRLQHGYESHYIT